MPATPAPVADFGGVFPGGGTGANQYRAAHPNNESADGWPEQLNAENLCLSEKRRFGGETPFRARNMMVALVRTAVVHDAAPKGRYPPNRDIHGRGLLCPQWPMHEVAPLQPAARVRKRRPVTI